MPKIIGGNSSNQNQGTGANSDRQSDKKPLQQTPPPTKSNNTSVVKASIAAKALLFQPAPQQVTLSQPKKEIDLKKAFEFLGHPPEIFPQMIKAMQSGEFNLMLPDEDGDNALHTAAYGGIKDFFEFIMGDMLIVDRMIEKIPEQVKDKNPINIMNEKKHTTVLGNAIHNDHFDLALELIRNHGANVHQLVHDTLNEADDNTASMLRLAFSSYFTTTFTGDPKLENCPGYTESQKSALLELCKELLSKGLTFFDTPGSHCPPAFQLGIRRPIIGEGHKKYIKDHKLTLDQFILLENLKLLEKNSPVIFKLFLSEAQNVKEKKRNAQDIVQIWNWYELNRRPTIEPVTQTTPVKR